MNAYYVLSLFAPYVTFMLYMYKKLDIKSTIVYVLAFDVCFLISIFTTPFFGVVAGVGVYVVAMVLIKTLKHTAKKYNDENL